MNRAANLYALQLTDSEIDRRRRRLAKVISLLGETEELAAARRRLEKAQAALAALRAKQRDQELALQTLERKRHASEQRLYGGQISNPKELSDRQEEIESLGRRKSASEEELLETMLQAEECEAERAGAAGDLGQTEAKWTVEQTDLRAEREEHQRQLAELEAEHNDRVTAISPADLSRYQHLRERKGGVAVTLLKGAECQGCMTAVSAARAREARGGESLALCGTCGRILFAG